ncbi:MAG: tetratricopeptide repeat protein [Deltaproteobacteria bacterium]|nr:tetratricopeptide repeat protein [Deltaproteobacteria bacterium]
MNTTTNFKKSSFKNTGSGFPALYLLALLAALIMAGCTIGEGNPRLGRRPAAPPPQAQPEPTATAEIQTLRAQNDELQNRLGETEQRVESLKRELSAEQEKQRRFRESMTTNFDLLEQSVALTLSNTINTRNPGEQKSRSSRSSARPAPATRPEPAAQPASKPAPAIPQIPTVPASKPEPAVSTVPSTFRTSSTGWSQPLPGFKTPDSSESRTETGNRKVTLRSTGNGQTESVSMNDTLPEAAEAAPGVAEAMASQPGDPDLSGPTNPRKLSAHPEAKPLYERAFAHFARKEFDQSIVLFEDFLERYPADNHSDNAQFWVGEAHLRMGRMEQAEDAYRKVLRNFEHRSTLDGYKTPDAIYRLGQTFMERKNHRTARVFYEAAADRYPATSAGRRAQTQLDSIVYSTAAK